MRMSITALKTLIGSSKATVLVAVVAMLAVMLFLKTIDAQQFLDTLKVLVPSWMVAHAGERGAKAIANGVGKPKAISVVDGEAEEADDDPVVKVEEADEGAEKEEPKS
jgi:hypothetical protein